ncbi:MAG: deoxynucleoside kinase [bacterium]
MSFRRPVRSELANRGETRVLTYVVVEGPPGSGKTDLAGRIARRLGGRLVLDRASENPFLEQFYRDPQRFAFKTQLFFTLSRYMQQQEIAQLDLFSGPAVSDLLFARDRIYASLGLDDRELALYEKLAGLMAGEVPRPDLVVYLQCGVRDLEERLGEREGELRRLLGREYLVAVRDAYDYFFLHYEEAPLLVVGTRDADPSRDDSALDTLMREMERPQSGMRYLNLRP